MSTLFSLSAAAHWAIIGLTLLPILVVILAVAAWYLVKYVFHNP